MSLRKNPVFFRRISKECFHAKLHDGANIFVCHIDFSKNEQLYSLRLLQK